MEEFLTNLKYFTVILGKKEKPDQYCMGLTFGHLGSKMLVKFANLLIHPVDDDGNIIPAD